MSTEELIFEKPEYVAAATAAAQGDVSALQRLASQGIDPNYEGKETKTPWGSDTVTLLLWAVLSDSVTGAEALLKAGADPNKPTRRGMTPLIMASALKNGDLFTLLLVRYKADPNKVYGRDSSVPRSALMTTLQEGKWDRAELLLQHGADVNLNLDRGKTALTSFGKLEYWRAVLWLLEHGADYEARDNVRATVMCLLRSSMQANTLAKTSEGYVYRNQVREWLLARNVARSRVDPELHPSPKCDD